MVTSNVPGSKRKSAFSSWFGPGYEEEKVETIEPPRTPYLWDDSDVETDPKPGRSESFDRRRTFSGESRPKSAIALSQASKPRIRTTPLKRTASISSDPFKNSGHLIRMSSKNDTAVMILPKKKNESSEENGVNTDSHSAQSSITNSWAPRLRLYHPAPYVPHKPIENMVISIHKPGSESDARGETGKNGDDHTNSSQRNTTEFLNGVRESDDLDMRNNESMNACMLSLALTEEQKADVEKYVFRGWGSDDDGDCVPPHQQSGTPNNPEARQTNGKFSVRQEASPPSTPQAIRDAIHELKAVAGIQVKCLDGDIMVSPDAAQDDPAARLSDTNSLHALTRDKKDILSSDIEEPSNEKQSDDHKLGWFFGAQARKVDDLNDRNDDLCQPYALIRNEKDEERFRRHYEEEERLRREEDIRVEQEKKKKKSSWFFFGKEEESVVEKHDESIADALDDLEILAGEVRVSQVKEARLLEKDQRTKNREPSGNPDELDVSLRSNPLPALRNARDYHIETSHSLHGPLESQGNASTISQVATRSKPQQGDRKKSFLSRFELPLENGDDHNNVENPKEESTHLHRPLTQFIGASALWRARASKDGITVNETAPQEAKAEDPAPQEVEIDDYVLPTTTKASDLQKMALIADLSKRDLRWRLNQASVNSVFNRYHSVMAGIDDLLPSQDEFDNFKHLSESIDVQFRDVRNKMLEDGNLSEREISSFFAGFALHAVKARSLQSQLDAFRAVSRATAEERRLSTVDSEEALAYGECLHDTPKILLARNMQADAKVRNETKALLRQLEVNERERVTLEKELSLLGNPLPEHIPFDEAKGAMERIHKKIDELRLRKNSRMPEMKQNELDSTIKELEKQIELNAHSVTMGGLWIKAEEKWEAENAAQNIDALCRIRRHMPVNVEMLNEDQLAIEATPSGKLLPRRIAKKFKHTNILQLLRAHPDVVYNMHPTTLENLQTTGLTLSERRAIYTHLRGVGMQWRASSDDPAALRKWLWFRMLKQEFKEALLVFKGHCREYGPPESHLYATRANPTSGCPLIAKQCPVKVEKMFDYGIDYGFPDGDVFFECEGGSDQKPAGTCKSPGVSKRILLEKAVRRREPLERHYKGRVLETALACDSCQAMDKIMDQIEILQESWIENRLRREKVRFTDLHRRIEIGSFAAAVHELKLSLTPLAERSGMQLTGNRESNGARPDHRSPIELGLCEEVWEHAEDYFTGIESRLKELDATDSDLKTEIDQLRELIDELHNRNMSTINELGVRYPEASRKLMKRGDIARRLRDRLSKEVIEGVAETSLCHAGLTPSAMHLSVKTEDSLTYHNHASMISVKEKSKNALILHQNGARIAQVKDDTDFGKIETSGCEEASVSEIPQMGLARGPLSFAYPDRNLLCDEFENEECVDSDPSAAVVRPSHNREGLVNSNEGYHDVAIPSLRCTDQSKSPDDGIISKTQTMVSTAKKPTSIKGLLATSKQALNIPNSETTKDTKPSEDGPYSYRARRRQFRSSTSLPIGAPSPESVKLIREVATVGSKTGPVTIPLIESIATDDTKHLEWGKSRSLTQRRASSFTSNTASAPTTFAARPSCVEEPVNSNSTNFPRWKSYEWRERIAQEATDPAHGDADRRMTRLLRDRTVPEILNDGEHAVEPKFECSTNERRVSLPSRYARRTNNVEESTELAVSSFSSGRRLSMRARNAIAATNGEDLAEATKVHVLRGAQLSNRERTTGRKSDSVATDRVSTPNHGNRTKLKMYPIARNSAATSYLEELADQAVAMSRLGASPDWKEKPADVKMVTEESTHHPSLNNVSSSHEIVGSGISDDPRSSDLTPVAALERKVVISLENHEGGVIDLSQSDNFFAVEESESGVHISDAPRSLETALAKSFERNGHVVLEKGIAGTRDDRQMPYQSPVAIASGSTCVSGSTDSALLHSPEKESLALLAKIAAMRRDVLASDPFVVDSYRGETLPDPEMSSSEKGNVQSSVDASDINGASHRMTNASNQSSVERHGNPVRSHSARRSSQLLQERIAAGKSPTRDRIAAGKSPRRDRSSTEGDSAERLAALEARRASVQAVIAERRKARSDAEKAYEIKYE